MVYYLFRVDEKDIQENKTQKFIEFLESLVTKYDEKIDYLPSKRRVVLSQTVNIDSEIESYIKEFCDFKLEYESHDNDTRKFIQYDPETNEVYISYLLPLFPAEDLMKL